MCVVQCMARLTGCAGCSCCPGATIPAAHSTPSQEGTVVHTPLAPHTAADMQAAVQTSSAARSSLTVTKLDAERHLSRLLCADNEHGALDAVQRSES